ncbi:hypothetical protein JQ615_01070 [Bradyrhizobium jicamae]|uniref:Uncharacterized protein n=1 Tax=Bradyrhizobium jicamae TaxID=280332 RepID=A0ABS5FB10_9BRAD|nr:hypothetical protein [Bradyrhizobium jicamae]MBR0793972.1 hypothetical protein [Bradyrhizobium jicamae]
MQKNRYGQGILIRFLPTLAVTMCLVTPCLGSEKKTDVLGVTAGLPMMKVADVGDKKGWNCGKLDEEKYKITVTCTTKLAQQEAWVFLTFANALPNKPLVGIEVEFKSVTTADVVASLSQQYGPPNNPTPPQFRLTEDITLERAAAYWKFGDGSELVFTNRIDESSHRVIEETSYLKLTNASLGEANAKVIKERDRAAQPVPKF